MIETLDNATRERMAFLDVVCSAKVICVLGEFVNKKGLSVSEYAILLLLLKCPGLNQKKLSGSTGLNVNTVTRALDSLEKKRLAKRRANPFNRKETFPELTIKGRELIELVLAAMVEHQVGFYSKFAPEDIMTLFKILSAVYSHGRRGDDVELPF